MSGLAEGIDTAAQQSAIEAGGKTIAVLGTPLDTAYPAENKTLLEKIKTHHLAVSQLAFESTISAEIFPLRNRTMALLSHATIIAEATERSGSWHMGWETLRLGRRLFILRSAIENNGVTWPKKLLKYGALKLTRDSLRFFLSTIQKIVTLFRSHHPKQYLQSYQDTALTVSHKRPDANPNHPDQ